MSFMKKWRGQLEKIDTKLAQSGPRKTEPTADSINIDELLPKFMENMRREREESVNESPTTSDSSHKNEMELLAMLKTGTDPNEPGSPFSTYSAYNKFFGIPQPSEPVIYEENEDDEQNEYEIKASFVKIELERRNLSFKLVNFFKIIKWQLLTI